MCMQSHGRRKVPRVPYVFTVQQEIDYVSHRQSCFKKKKKKANQPAVRLRTVCGCRIICQTGWR